jgi:hypothetical protein
MQDNYHAPNSSFDRVRIECSECKRLRAEVGALKRIIDYAVNELTSMEEANAQTLLADIRHEQDALAAAAGQENAATATQLWSADPHTM